MPSITPIILAVLPEAVRIIGDSMTKKSRDKGARGEREAAALLRKALPDGWTVERFGTGESGHDLRILSPEGERPPFAIEVKRYADFEVGEVLRGPSARFLAWWTQARTQAGDIGREPILLTRGDRRPWWLWSPRQYGPAGCVVELMIPLTDEISECVIGVPLDSAIDDLVFELVEGSRND